MRNYLGDFVSGFGEGVENATNRAINGLTLGLSDKINPEARFLQQELQERAENTGVGDAQKTLDTIAEIGGGLYPASKFLNIAGKTGLSGIKQLTAAGGLEGATRGIINSDSLGDAGKNAITEGAIGSLFSGVTGYAFNSLVSGANLLRKDVNKGIVYLRDKLGADELNSLISEARTTGRSLVEVADSKALNMLDKARLQTEDAADIIDTNVTNIKRKAVDKADEFLDSIFSTQQGWKTAEEVKEAADHASGQIFKGLYNLGDVTKISPDLDNFIKGNDLVKYAIRQVKNDVTVPKEIRKLPYGDMRILERARQRLNDMAGRAVATGNKSQIKDITEAKNAFLNSIYGAVPQYENALNIYNQAHRLREAVDMGEKVFKRSVNPEKFAEDFSKLEDYEKDALKLGLRDKIYEILGTNGSWKNLTYRNVANKIKTVLGEEEGQKLIDFANHEVRRQGNINKLLGGSKTAEKQIKKVPFSLINTGIELINTFGDVGRKSRNKGIAKLMTNPSSDVAEKAINSLDNKIDNALLRYLNATPEVEALANYLAKESKL